MKRLQHIVQLIIIISIVFIINIIANYFYGSIDLTEEKRYTLSQSTFEVIEQIEDKVFIRVLLEGDFPSGFQRLRNSTQEMLDDLRDINPNIEYIFEDPVDGTISEIKARRDQLAKDGVIPVNLTYNDGTEVVQKGIYPFALITYRGKTSQVSLLKNQSLNENEEVTLNKSIEQLEYKFVNHIYKLTKQRRQTIGFTTGNGEIYYENTIVLEKELEKFYDVGRINLDSLVSISNELDLLIIAAPQVGFDEKKKFKLDQYIMNGGRVIYLLEKLTASLDSINKHRFYIPEDIDTGLDDMLFKYGAKILPNLVLDLESSSIPQIVGEQDGKPQTAMYKWPYHTLALPNNNHPIGKNIDRVNMFFPSSIDTVKTKYAVKKTPVLSTSPYSRLQYNPVRLNFEILKFPPDQNKYNKGKQTLGMLLEGSFSSLFENRITSSFQEGLDKLGIEFVGKSVPTKQLVLSDADFMSNLVNRRTGKAEPMGFNLWDRYNYEGNRDFMLNAVEFMLNDNSILDSRSKQLKLRLLDAVKTKQEKKKWQFINIGLPLLFLALFGILFNFIRRRRFTK